MIKLFLNIFILCFAFNVFSQKTTITKLKFTVDLKNSRKISKDNFGTNSSRLWGKLRYGDDALATHSIKLGTPLVRFPGGTPANAYNWKDGRHSAPKRATDYWKKRIPAFNHPLSDNSQRTYDVKDFIKFLKQTKSEFILVVNVVNSTPENTREQMLYYKNRGIQVKRVEMGNEVYFYSYNWTFTPTEYREISKKHTKAVKSVFPNAKVGLVFPSQSYTTDTYLQIEAEEKMQTRKDLIRAAGFEKVAINSDFSDAMIIHIYPRTGMHYKVKRKDWRTYIQTYSSCISHFDGHFAPTIERMHKLAPKKEIWLTEWALAAFTGGQRKYGTFGFANVNHTGMSFTYLTGLFAGHGFLTIFKNPYIKLANFHGGVWDNRTPDYKKNSSYYPLLMFADPAKYCTKIADVQVKNAGTYKGSEQTSLGEYPQVNAGYFYNKNGGYLFFINKFNKSFSISQESLKKSAIASKCSEITYFRPKSYKKLTSSLEAINAWDYGTQIIQRKGMINIKPYSITRIKIGIPEKNSTKK
ncbi:MAG: hypothetical protein L3J71_12655 [Victivallaceae bacterium]|nr:hypothetical protein [Victivallaceae bacterium]